MHILHPSLVLLHFSVKDELQNYVQAVRLKAEAPVRVLKLQPPVLQECTWSSADFWEE